MRHRLTILLWLLISAMASTAALAERRVALVVGNAQYASTVALKNPTNDAQDVAASLRQLGFDVILATDVDQAAFARQIDNFARRLEGADVGLFYYAGHGLQMNEKNYLVSVNAKLDSEFLVPSETIDLEAVIRLMESRAPVNLVFLDACRNNPLADNLRRSMIAQRRSVALGRGLAKVDPTGRDTLVAFSAAPGQEASDGEGRNSPFAVSLLRHMPEAGVEISVMLKLVSADVRQATGNSQRPQQLSDMTQTFYFAKADPAPDKPDKPAPIAAPVAGGDGSIEVAFFQSASAANDCQAIRSYLNRYPNGTFTDLARLSEKRLCNVENQLPPERAPAVIAALPPATAPAPVAPSAADIARNMQTELIRVGCSGTGLITASGNWDAASKAALALFNRYANAKLTSPSQDAIAAIHGHDERVCPLECGAGFQARGNTCIAVPAQPASPSKPEKQEASRPRPAPRAVDNSPPAARPPRTAGPQRPGQPPTEPGTWSQGGMKCHISTSDVLREATVCN